MSKPVPTKGASLLERAAQVYDFQAHLRARDGVTAEPEARPLPIEPESPITPEAREPVPVAVEENSGDEPFLPGVSFEEMRLSVDEFLADRERSAPAHSAHPLHQVAIDRTHMAENHLLIPDAPVGVLAEEFRLAKRQLLLTIRSLVQVDPEKARTILVCSPKPGDGKTYCAVNLAISMAAERNTRVLLVDADFPKPDVLKRLGVAVEGPGLLDVLADSGLSVEDCVVATDIPQLSLLPAGTRTNADTELAASDRTSDVIADLLEADPHRIIIFDSPPALAASPAAVLALHVGQVMLVVRADRTSENDIRDAVQRLDGCEEIRLLLNGAAFTTDGYRYGNYYGQGDGQ